MDTATVLPHVNAALNAVSTVLLLIGFGLIRAGRRDAHRAVMIAALAVSAVFLISYLVYHFTAPIFVFPGRGTIRVIYYIILVSHVILAVAIVPLVVEIVRRAWTGRFDRHKALARWTLPLWLYVTVTGVAIYGMLYHLYPQASGA
ncbi:DUF420 domain-containing protein [Roseospira marina]|uniref:DUF420 domain-containing protein n=1 Tax=Roseospira marina TaxID=140057 RepID=A0A5M6ID79_9PROT|nr:DUF420 domain-containing protein [Roseospira marina]KAA5606216.1 DUF420 domain-containing protein [Roseospira marina]MBB4314365.1 uncharacterized membrane protein YozB (DUF420 family) [Roseospira marina]MBB5087525.1 uncharacterized membrane protein YozB (DUF420 family) [Roseospira marina]